MASDRPPRPPLPPINFAALADALLGQADVLVPQWLAGGVRRGHEYQCGSVAGGEGTSCSVNLVTGRWADFATGEQGGDLVSLYGAAFGLTAAKSAVTLAQLYGLEGVAGVVGGGSAAPPPPRPPPPAPPPAPPRRGVFVFGGRGRLAAPAEKEQWRVVSPAPADAPKATFWDYHYQASDIRHVARYALTDGPDGAGDVLYGYVVRFARSDRGKLTKPYNWCVSERDGSGKWLSKTWEVPRPLYLPGATLPAKRTVVLVEGERKAEVLHLLLEREAPGVYCVATWAGGANGWKKARWPWLAGSTVLLWADCDGKREPLSKADEAACLGDALALEVARAAKPLLPEHKQPGMAAMLGIGALLEAEHGCKVQVLAIPAPLEVVDGWDCADAIETDGWGLEQVQGLFATARALPAGGTTAKVIGLSAAKKIDGPAGADGGDGADRCRPLPEWLAPYWDAQKMRWMVSRKLVIAALERDPALAGVLGKNQLSNNIEAREAWPWAQGRKGPVTGADDLLLGQYLSSTYGLPSIPRAALVEAIETVGHSRPYHPVQDYLRGLTWDGTVRRRKWLLYAIGETPESLAPAVVAYLALVGSYWLQGMAQRVMEPGCKFDYCPVLEGPGGLGKSTLIEVLASTPFFSDTHFDVARGKDGQEQVQGLWMYEIAELASFGKAEIALIKAFISAKVDRYRPSYGRVVESYPRQCLLAGSTNERTYLRDRTGNRRFWPIPVRNPIRVAWVRKWRDQLLAEAYAMHLAGERYTPTPEEEALLFVPMQEARLVDTSVTSGLWELLTRAPGQTGMADSINELTEFCTMAQLTMALGSDASKSSPALEAQVRAWLDHEGWGRCKRQVNGHRAWGYARPANWPPVEPMTTTQPPGGAAPIDTQDADDAPF